MPSAEHAIGPRPLYTPEERRRRDASPWTIVQGVLAPLQLLAFLVSVWLVLQFLRTGDGATAATWSVLVKTGFLYAIMITGAIWEREVFGVWVFAPSFFWEDVVSTVVIALHTAYLYVWLTDSMPLRDQFWLALLAYSSYVINAVQFFWKLQRAKRDQRNAATNDDLWVPG